MIRFKTFAAGEYTDQDITDFGNQHIVVKDKYLENGTIYLYYKDPADVGVTAIDFLTRLDNAIVTAQNEKFDAERGIDEMDSSIADTQEQISKHHPNDGALWDKLQDDLKFFKNQRTQHELTIEGRDKQIVDLMSAVQGIVL